VKKGLILISALLLSITGAAASEVGYTVASPDGHIKVVVTVGTELYFTAYYNDIHLTASSIISMTANGRLHGQACEVWTTREKRVDNMVASPLYKSSKIQESYNETAIWLRGGFGVVFRAYNEGFAYRFFNYKLQSGDVINNESLNLRFDKDYVALVPYSTSESKPYKTSFENRYTEGPISEFSDALIAFSPILVKLDDGLRMVVTEADLQSYPGMFFQKGNDNGMASLQSTFAQIPDKLSIGKVRCEEVVESYSSDIAEIHKNATKQAPIFFPWRAFAVSTSDAGLLSNNLVYLLGEPSRIADPTWVKPGKIAWDWWNDWSLTGVDFKAGINTETYKYYIDFAASHGIEYVVLDEGWSPSADGDIMKVLPELDLPELVKYADNKGVGLILWAVAYTLDKKLDEACDYYSKMGIKGFKVDFINRDDQKAVERNWRIASTAAKYRLMVDFHGMYKPAGFNRTYPNVINFEGIWGLEQMKWSTDDMVTFDVTFPYIRMVSGPVDYTQGATRNMTRDEFVPNWSHPASQGTRSRQVAEYVIFDSPLVMLCDSPSAYMKEEEMVDFITAIPTVWDETRGLQGEIGRYIVTARRSGERWFIGGMTDWNERDITLDLSFTGRSKVKATIFRDGVNSDKTPSDYKCETVDIDTSVPYTIHLSPGGGFAVRIE